MWVPDGLRWLAQEPEGARWLESLPERVGLCAERWSLELGEPFSRCFVGYVVPATTAAGERRVLKIQFPHAECTGEAEALRVWDGRGAIRLVDDAPELDALLLERCEPGTSLEGASEAEVHPLLVELLRFSFVPAGPPIPMLSQQLDAWDAQMHAAVGLPDELIQLATTTMQHLSATAEATGLVNLDLHRDNVLESQRQPWLVIDPKPIIGEHALALANRLPMYGIGEIEEATPNVGARLDQLSTALKLPPERARGWAFVRATTWACDDSPLRAAFIETARQLEPTAHAILRASPKPG